MEITLDGALMTDRAAAHDLLAKEFAFPDYYGRNLDALYDLLSTYPTRTRVTVVHGAQLHENLGNYGKTLLKTLQEAAASNANITLSIFDEII